MTAEHEPRNEYDKKTRSNLFDTLNELADIRDTARMERDRAASEHEAKVHAYQEAEKKLKMARDAMNRKLDT